MTGDDPSQFERARKAFKRNDVFVPDTVILETAWVLGYAYGLEREAIARALRTLCGQENVRLANPALVAQAIDWYEGGLDFADAFHLANSGSCSRLLTFDTKFVRKAKGLAVCKVTDP